MAGWEIWLDGSGGVDDDVEVGAGLPGAGGDEHDVVDPDVGEVGAAVSELVGRLSGGESAAERDLDVVGVPPDGVAGAGEHVELVANGGAAVGDVEEVAGVRVAGHERKGAVFSHPADEDSGPVDRGGLVDRRLEAVVAAAERSGVAVPHVGGELEELFEAAEALGRGFERQAEIGGLVGLVAGAHTEPRPTAREHVEGGHDLDQECGRAHGRPGDHGAELHGRGRGGEEAEGGVGLEHRFVDAGGGVHLQEVVGDPQGVETGLVDGAGQLRQM